MDANFWHERWNSNRIGFHQAKPNPLLVAHFQALKLEKGAHIFVPLCGKTNDIGWLLAQGFRVSGAELSELAVRQLFENLGVVPEITLQGTLKQYRASNISIFAGDIFELTRKLVGPIHAIYDRAALVALPPDMRTLYSSHLRHLSASAPQFVICFEYDQNAMTGPPFSIPQAEVERLYADHYTLEQLANVSVEGGMKGVIPATEQVWYLR